MRVVEAIVCRITMQALTMSGLMSVLVCIGLVLVGAWWCWCWLLVGGKCAGGNGSHVAWSVGLGIDKESRGGLPQIYTQSKSTDQRAFVL